MNWTSHAIKTNRKKGNSRNKIGPQTKLTFHLKSLNESFHKIFLEIELGIIKALKEYEKLGLENTQLILNLWFRGEAKTNYLKLLKRYNLKNVSFPSEIVLGARPSHGLYKK